MLVHQDKNAYIRVLGPIALSAFSILLTALLVEPIITQLDPSYTVLANRGIGKIVISLIAMTHTMLLASTFSRDFLQTVKQTCFSWLWHPNTWLKPFFTYFGIFAASHCLVLAGLCLAGYATYNPTISVSFGLVWSCVLGFAVTFLLAWSEELIFRGAVFSFLRTSLAPWPSILLSSAIFTAAHDLTNPLRLATTNWRLGLGLFLLGILLAQLFHTTGRLYTGMGAHAGLVFIKVILRRLPLVTLESALLPWWLAVDLRQSFFVHILFAAGIFVVWYLQRRT